MKKMLMISLFLCGISFAVFSMDYKRIALTGGTGVMFGALAPALIHSSLPKRLIKENPEAYTSIVVFGGILGVGYGLVSSYSARCSKPTIPMETNMVRADLPIARSEFDKLPKPKLRIEPFYTIRE